MSDSHSKIAPEVLAEFCDGFYGYGSYSAPYWFIGMEEGGCSSFEELGQRVAAWSSRGRLELEDLVRYHAAISVTEWFGAKPKLQSTWKGLIRAGLVAQGVKPGINAIRDYQANRLGRLGGEDCLLELLPLPSKSIGSWPYQAVGDLACLRNRADYTAEFLPRRLAHLVGRARERKPLAVVCYGLTYGKHWDQFSDAGLAQREIEGAKAFTGQVGGAPLLVVQHPAAHGVTSAYFEAVGRLIAGG